MTQAQQQLPDDADSWRPGDPSGPWQRPTNPRPGSGTSWTTNARYGSQSQAQPSWQPQYQQKWQSTPPGVTGEEKTWAIAAHLSALLAWLVSAGWLTFVGPLLVWLFKKNTSPYVRAAAAQSFNFNVGMWLLSLLGWIFIVTILLLPIGLILLLASFLLTLWHHVRAALATSRNELYRYPFQFPILH